MGGNDRNGVTQEWGHRNGNGVSGNGVREWGQGMGHREWGQPLLFAFGLPTFLNVCSRLNLFITLFTQLSSP